MTTDLMNDAHAVLLPAFAGTTLSDECTQFLSNGGASILLGETREEYVARTMSNARRKAETKETFHKVIAEAKQLAGDLLVAVDQEVGGIERLHHLAPSLPSSSDFESISVVELETHAHQVGCAAAELGINCFLAPIVDVVTGKNPWLHGRTVSSDAQIVAQISSAFVRGVQKAGIAATAKHFPGFHNIELDPAIESEAVVIGTRDSYAAGLDTFRAVIAEHVEIVMVGPATVPAIDPHKAALRSSTVINLLKNDLAFEGLVLSDDLDAKATMRGDPIEQVAIDAINAGCDLLLLADVKSQLSDVTTALVDAANDGILQASGLAHSAAKVRALARKYRTSIKS